MAQKTDLMEKRPVDQKVLPCQDARCDIATNKRYRSPGGTVYVACCFDHVGAVYRLDLARQRKALALVAA